MENLNIRGFEKLYNIILAQLEAKKLYGAERGFKNPSMSSEEVELQIAVLTNDKRTNEKIKSDLTRSEVKCLQYGNAAEFQYHKKNGATKLQNDQNTHVILFRYHDKDYHDIDIDLILATDVAPLVESWVPGFHETYANPAAKRYRKIISHGFIENHKIYLLKIRNGKIINETLDD